MEAVPLNAVVEHPTLNSVRNLANQLATFMSHFTTTKWEGKHSFLPLLLTKTKIRLDAGNQDLNHGSIKRPKLLKLEIKDDTKGREILHFQENHKVNWN